MSASAPFQSSSGPRPACVHQACAARQGRQGAELCLSLAEAPTRSAIARLWRRQRRAAGWCTYRPALVQLREPLPEGLPVDLDVHGAAVVTTAPLAIGESASRLCSAASVRCEIPTVKYTAFEHERYPLEEAPYFVPDYIQATIMHDIHEHVSGEHDKSPACQGALRELGIPST